VNLKNSLYTFVRFCNKKKLTIIFGIYTDMIYGGIAREKCELFHFHRRKGNFIKKKYLRQKINYRGMIKSLQQKLIFLCEGTAHTVWHANYSF
jgi:hypothetical protein